MITIHVLYGSGMGRKARPFYCPAEASKFAKKVNGKMKNIRRQSLS